MGKKKQHSFSSVLSVNPYKDSYLNGVSNLLTVSESAEFKKEQFTISHLNTKDFINTHVQISKNIPSEDIYDAITNKVYDDLALDQAVIYQIQFIETFNNLDEENRHFHVFIVNPDDIAAAFENVVEKIKYLDIIIPSPLLIKSLYSKELIQSSGAHCFIYFQENNTFITVYNNGEFTYTKSLNYSLVQMHDRFCELYGEKIEFKEFIDFLSTHNLKNTTSDYKEHLIKLYKEIFANVNDILTYVKRAFDIDKIEHLYIGAQIPTVTKLDEFAEVELSIKASDFEFDYGFERSDEYVDQLHVLMHTYTQLHHTQKYTCNFTLYPRPPKFTQRESGKLILLTAASLLVAFAYPLLYWVLTYTQVFQEDASKLEFTQVRNEKLTREASINSKQSEKNRVDALLKQEREEYIDKKSTLIKIHDVKVNYPMKAKLLHMLTKDLYKYRVELESLSYKQDKNTKNFNLSILSTDNTNITMFLEYLTVTYEGKFNFSLKDISYDKNHKKYFSELKVKML